MAIAAIMKTKITTSAIVMEIVTRILATTDTKRLGLIMIISATRRHLLF
jgi:hypothetical protein